MQRTRVGVARPTGSVYDGTVLGMTVRHHSLTLLGIRVQQFRTVGASFTTCFDWLMGGVDFTIFQDTHNPQVGIILLLLYWCVFIPLIPKSMQSVPQL